MNDTGIDFDNNIVIKINKKIMGIGGGTGAWIVLLLYGWLSLKITKYIQNWYAGDYRQRIVECEQRTGRYGNTPEYLYERKNKLQCLKDERDCCASICTTMFLFTAIFFCLLMGHIATILTMATLLNDTMLNSTGIDFDFSPLLDTVSHTFSPGLNIGFIGLLVLSIAFHEHPSTPMMGVFAAYMGGYVWMNNLSIWSLLLEYWLKIIVYAVGYIVIGAVWTVPKWWIYVRKSKNHDRLKQSYDQKLNKRGRSTIITPDDKYNAALSIVGENKYKFYTWMMWWPLNVIYTLARDPLTVLYNWLYARLTNTFAKILLSAFDESPKPKNVSGPDDSQVDRETDEDEDNSGDE